MPRLLELFSGTGSVGRAFRDRGWEVVSLDVDPKAGATICADILKWDYAAEFPKGHFDFVWASPSCQYYSRARTKPKSTEDQLRYADSLVQRSLEIINFYGVNWAFENPQTGFLKNRPFMIELDLPYADVTYCKYGGVRYKKATRIWHSLGDHWQPRPVCCKGSRCEHFEHANNRHPCSAQRGPCRSSKGMRTGDDFTQNELFHIPNALCDEIARAAGSIVALKRHAAVHEERASMEREAPEELRRN